MFLFAEILINNRDKIKESESFVLTLHKDKLSNDANQKRINLKKILSLEDMINKPYSKVTIELNERHDLEEIKRILNNQGHTQVILVFHEKNKKITYNLKKSRKFDYNQLKTMKNKEYVKKNNCIEG